MAIVCSVCGKKQSGFIQDYPLSNEFANQRICNVCNTQKERLYSSSKRDITEYDNSRNYFVNHIEKTSDKSVESALINILHETDLHAEKLKNQVNQEFLENEKIKQEEQRKKDIYKNHLLTSGFNFEGYAVKKYNGVICKQVIIGTGFLSEFKASFSDFFGVESVAFSNKLDEAREIALEQLINESISLGSNAIIGLDFDYLTLTNNMLGVSANGTSVIIEKLDY